MNTLKRIFLFMAVNALVVITISLVLNLLGVRPYMTAYGIDYQQLAVFCLVWGMGGSLISLAMSRMMARWMMGVQLIDPNTQDSQEQWLVQTVYSLARSAHLPKMPQVGIYQSPELNAFATGPSASRSLVAVSSGLFDRMNREEIEGVLGHEITHISNGDMVTMTLIQGVVNAFVMFLARVIAFAIDNALRSRDDERGGGLGRFGYMIVVMLLEWVFMFFGMMVIAGFSRWREYRADAGGARIAGRQNMIAALRKLQQTYDIVDAEASQQQSSFRALKISTHRGVFALLSTHPPLDKRIEALERAV